MAALRHRPEDPSRFWMDGAELRGCSPVRRGSGSRVLGTSAVDGLLLRYAGWRGPLTCPEVAASRPAAPAGRPKPNRAGRLPRPVTNDRRPWPAGCPSLARGSGLRGEQILDD